MVIDMITGRTKLWPHFTYAYRIGQEKYYRCNYCGEIVASNERRRHLRFKHPEIWEKLKVSI